MSAVATVCVCDHLTAIHLYPYGCASCECERVGLAAIATDSDRQAMTERLRLEVEILAESLLVASTVAVDLLHLLEAARSALQPTRRWYTAHDELAKKIDVALGREECVPR